MHLAVRAGLAEVDPVAGSLLLFGGRAAAVEESGEDTANQVVGEAGVVAVESGVRSGKLLEVLLDESSGGGFVADVVEGQNRARAVSAVNVVVSTVSVGDSDSLVDSLDNLKESAFEFLELLDGGLDSGVITFVHDNTHVTETGLDSLVETVEQVSGSVGESEVSAGQAGSIG